MAFAIEKPPFDPSIAERLVRKWLPQTGDWKIDSARISAPLPVYDIVLERDAADDRLVLASWRSFVFGDGQPAIAVDFAAREASTIHRSFSGPRVDSFVALAAQADARIDKADYACRLVEADLSKLAAVWLFGAEELFFVAAAAREAGDEAAIDRAAVMALARERFEDKD